MNASQVELVLTGYESEILQAKGSIDIYMEPKERLKKSADLNHLLEMIPKAISFMHDQRTEKAMRWLGFIQGSLWAHGIYNIEEMKNHNRGTEEE